MTDLPFRKLYVDTRFKTFDSVSNSDFKYQLRVPSSMPINTTFCVDEINIPYSWNTIEVGINDKLYVGHQINAAAMLVYTTIIVPPKRYSGGDLATQIQTQLNALNAGAWVLTYDTNANTMMFASNHSAFKIFTDDDLATTTNFPAMNNRDPQSINEILQISGSYTGYINKSTVPFHTGFLNLLNYQDIYLTSGNLGSFDSQGTRGESSIIRKVCVNAAWGFSIIDKISSDTDRMSCSKLALSTLDFALRDVKGRVIPLHGAHISFTIRFFEN